MNGNVFKILKNTKKLGKGNAPAEQGEVQWDALNLRMKQLKYNATTKEYIRRVGDRMHPITATTSRSQ